MITAEPCGKYELTLVSQGNIDEVFPRIRTMVEPELAAWRFPEWGIEELYRRLVTGEAQLWLVGEKGVKLVMVGVTRVVRYPAAKRLNVELIVGEDLEGCAALMEIAAKWAQQFGCTEVEASCRPGVRKVMQKYGFVKVREVIVRPIAGD